MKSAITKRSVVIGGHKTSVSLEEPFWIAVRELADAQGVTVSGLLRQIDLERRNTNLSSAIRVYVLQCLRGQTKPEHNGIVPTTGNVVWRADLGPA
jgi:predicted DNA-binding ribbon-helix-helix protein